jgi:hypothetical protein
MDFELVVALARSLERLGIIAVSGLSIWSGYRLFSIVTEAEASGRFEAKGVQFTIQRVGPGVFFALFGCLVLLYALASPMKLSSKGQRNEEGPNFSYGLPGKGKPSYEPTMGAINRLKLLATQARIATLSENEHRLLADASDYLRLAQQCLTDAEFGPGTYAEYDVVLGMCQKDPGQCDNYLRSEGKRTWFERVDDFNNATLR